MRRHQRPSEVSPRRRCRLSRRPRRRARPPRPARPRPARRSARGRVSRRPRANPPRSAGRADRSSRLSPERVSLCAETRASRPRRRRRWRASRRRAWTTLSSHRTRRRAGEIVEVPPRGSTARRTTSTPTRCGSAPTMSRPARRARAPRRRRNSPSPSPRVSRVLPCRAPRAVANAGTPSAASPRRECVRRGAGGTRGGGSREALAIRLGHGTRSSSRHAKTSWLKKPTRAERRQKAAKTKSVFRAVPCDVVEPPAPRRPKNSPRRVVERGEREKSAVRRPTSPSFLCPRPLGRILAFSAAPPAHHAARDRTRAPPRRRRAPRVTQGWRDGPLRRARATVRLEPAPGPIRARAVRPDFKRPTAPGGIGMAR
jgi:hypothetical protein